MKEAVNEELENAETVNENEHVIDMSEWTSLEFNINEDYNYIENRKIV